MGHCGIHGVAHGPVVCGCVRREPTQSRRPCVRGSGVEAHLRHPELDGRGRRHHGKRHAGLQCPDRGAVSRSRPGCRLRCVLRRARTTRAARRSARRNGQSYGDSLDLPRSRRASRSPVTVTISPTAIIYPDVELGDSTRVDEYVILGQVPGGNGRLGPLRIGEQATIRSHSVLYSGSHIGARLQTGHGVMIRESCRFGDDVSIGTHSIVEHHATLGNGVRVHSNAFIPEFSLVEEGAWIGPSVTFTNAMYPLSPEAKSTLKGPIIRRGAKIGANATLLPGVVIGVDALVGAGSVVVRDVPDGAVVAGNPARVIRRISDIPAYRLINSQNEKP
ncbi:MAG: hypothetical protein K5924_05630 [Chloroflexi bacterium]|nr:hypothetical protein [Chloroflexota bacterium]